MALYAHAFLFLGLALLSPGSPAAQELRLNQLIDHNVKAVGGHVAIKAVRSIRFDLHIIDADFEVDGIYYAQRPSVR